MATDDRQTDRRGTDAADHVCVFCGETFDPNERTTCPSCEATVVLRGSR
ncbi:hypothetical protein [Halorussus sp. AFM4]